MCESSIIPNTPRMSLVYVQIKSPLMYVEIMTHFDREQRRRLCYVTLRTRGQFQSKLVSFHCDFVYIIETMTTQVLYWSTYLNPNHHLTLTLTKLFFITSNYLNLYHQIVRSENSFEKLVLSCQSSAERRTSISTHPYVSLCGNRPKT